jgi:hypothetical protein
MAKKEEENKISTKELISCIKEYNPYCENITLATIFSKLNIDRINVINFGTQGTGKSRSTIELLKELNIGNEIIIDNNTTKKGFFQLLMNFPKSQIVMDECSSLLRDKAVQDAVKLAMEGKSVSWIKNNSVEETPEFKGSFIINSNDYLPKPIHDRCLSNKVCMNKEMTLNFIDYSLVEHNFDKFIYYLRDKIISEQGKKAISAKKICEISAKEKEEIVIFLKKYVSESEEGLEYSRRCIKRVFDYFKCAKNLFGKLDKEVMDYIKPFAELYVINQKNPSLIEAIVSNGKIDKAELIKKYSKEGGVSERTARNKVNEMIELGELELKGRLVNFKKR